MSLIRNIFANLDACDTGSLLFMKLPHIDLRNFLLFVALLLLYESARFNVSSRKDIYSALIERL